jgi:hypothetical protein
MFRHIVPGLVLAGLAVAKDPNQPVTRGSAEFSGGLSYARYTGGFNANGNYVKYPDSISPSAYLTPYRIRIGLGKGFETRADWSYINSNKDAKSRQGFSQPTIGIRYIAKNAGVFANLTLPFATGDFDNGGLNKIIETGLLLRTKTEYFRLTGFASYIDDLEDYEILRVWLRPEILWAPGFSTFVSGEYLKDLDEPAWLTTLGPGLRFDFTKDLAGEITTPFSVAGRNSPIAGWSIGAKGLWTVKF